MTEYDNTNRGAIWKNEDKKEANHPDYTGTLNVNGKEFNVAAWRRKPDANPKAPALSFSIKPKETTQSHSVQKASNGGFDDDVGW